MGEDHGQDLYCLELAHSSHLGLISREQRQEICWGAPGLAALTRAGLELEFRPETCAGLELELAAGVTGAWAGFLGLSWCT